MKREYILFGGVSILVGIIVLYCNSLFSIKLKLVHGVGPNLIADYHFYFYAIACFVLGLIFVLLGLIKK